MPSLLDATPPDAADAGFVPGAPMKVRPPGGPLEEVRGPSTLVDKHGSANEASTLGCSGRNSPPSTPGKASSRKDTQAGESREGETLRPSNRPAEGPSADGVEKAARLGASASATVAASESKQPPNAGAATTAAAPDGKSANAPDAAATLSPKRRLSPESAKGFDNCAKTRPGPRQSPPLGGHETMPSSALAAGGTALEADATKQGSLGKRVTIHYDNDVYTGELQDGKKHGQGKYTWANGRVFEGGWENGKRHGQGTMRFASGDVYDGDWIDGKMHGQGTMEYADDGAYDGDWVEDKWNGQGKVTLPNGDEHEGEWKDGQAHGVGKRTYDDVEIYHGEFQEGKKHGQGKYTWANGAVYEGGWKNGKMHGQGSVTYANGAVYDGEFKDDAKHGKGKYTYANGGVHHGEWKDDVRHGKGKYTMANGTVYDGEWKGDRVHGAGVLTLPENEDRYEGEWEHGKRHGQGKFTLPNGDEIYVGEWKDGKAQRRRRRIRARRPRRRSSGGRPEKVRDSSTLVDKHGSVNEASTLRDDGGSRRSAPPSKQPAKANSLKETQAGKSRKVATDQLGERKSPPEQLGSVAASVRATFARMGFRGPPEDPMMDPVDIGPLDALGAGHSFDPLYYHDDNRPRRQASESTGAGGFGSEGATSSSTSSNQAPADDGFSFGGGEDDASFDSPRLTTSIQTPDADKDDASSLTLDNAGCAGAVASSAEQKAEGNAVPKKVAARPDSPKSPPEPPDPPSAATAPTAASVSREDPSAASAIAAVSVALKDDGDKIKRKLSPSSAVGNDGSKRARSESLGSPPKRALTKKTVDAADSSGLANTSAPAFSFGPTSAAPAPASRTKPSAGFQIGATSASQPAPTSEKKGAPIPLFSLEAPPALSGKVSAAEEKKDDASDALPLPSLEQSSHVRKDRGGSHPLARIGSEDSEDASVFSLTHHCEAVRTNGDVNADGTSSLTVGAAETERPALSVADSNSESDGVATYVLRPSLLKSPCVNKNRGGSHPNEGEALPFTYASESLDCEDTDETEAQPPFWNNTQVSTTAFKAIIDSTAFSHMFLFLGQSDLNRSQAVSTIFAGASANALSDLMRVSIGCRAIVNETASDAASSNEVLSSVAKSMRRGWSYLTGRFPWGNFLSEGGFKWVYRVWNSHSGTYEALSVMDVNAIRDLGNAASVGSELAVSVLLSSLARRNICPNFVITRGVFTSQHAPPASLWGSQDDKSPLGDAFDRCAMPVNCCEPEPNQGANFQYIRMELCQHDARRSPDERPKGSHHFRSYHFVRLAVQCPFNDSERVILANSNCSFSSRLRIPCQRLHRRFHLYFYQSHAQ